MKVDFLPPLLQEMEQLLKLRPALKRQAQLEPLVDYLRTKLDRQEEIQLNFICTHNSRRSQFAQVWAQTWAHYFQLPLRAFSGGVEVTAFNPRAISCLREQGFTIEASETTNPLYQIQYGLKGESLQAYSKLYDAEGNPRSNFAALMTCSHAEENCPFIPGAECRIPLLYEDPKAFDDSPQEAQKYLERSRQIASELAYVYQQL